MIFCACLTLEISLKANEKQHKIKQKKDENTTRAKKTRKADGIFKFILK